LKSEKCIRTRTLGIRVADKTVYQGKPMMRVHHGTKEDLFGLRDCVDSLYGKEYRCILVSKSSTVVL
jgi:hypothetical protein